MGVQQLLRVTTAALHIKTLHGSHRYSHEVRGLVSWPGIQAHRPCTNNPIIVKKPTECALETRV